VAKAYSGLTDEEIDQLDRWIDSTPSSASVRWRAVDPVHVFELHFEALPEHPPPQRVAVRFPRIAAGAPTRSLPTRTRSRHCAR